MVAQFGQAAVESAGMTVEVAMDPRLQQAAEQAVQDGLRAVDKRQGDRGPLFRVPAAKVPQFVAALGRHLAAAAPLPGSLLLPDPGDLAERDRTSPEAAARAARVRTLRQGGVYAGV